MPAQRDKRAKFVGLAEKRVSRLLNDIRLIGNLANRSNYSYNDQDVARIFNVLDQEVKALKLKFKASRSSAKEFKLK
jgi:hypothetical protein